MGRPSPVMKHKRGVWGARPSIGMGAASSAGGMTARCGCGRPAIGRPSPVMEHEGGVGGATFNRDGSRVLSWGDDGTVRLWQASDGAALAVMKHKGRVGGATFNRDESRILSWGDDGTVRLWQASDGAAIAVMKHEGECGGRDLQSGWEPRPQLGGDGTVRLWDIQEDFDLSRNHLRLLVEVVTGTVMDDVGNVSAIPPEEWTKRKKQYRTNC